MSNIIDESLIFQIQSSNSLQSFMSNCIKSQQNHWKSEKDKIVKLLTLFLRNINSQYLIQNFTDIPNSQIRFKILFYDPNLYGMSLILTVRIDLTYSIIETQFSMVDGQKSYRVQSLDQRILLCKLFSKSYINMLNKVCISIYDGSFKIIRARISHADNQFTEILTNKNNPDSINNLIKNSLKEITNLLKPILKQIFPSQSEDYLEQKYRFPVNISKILNRYIIRSPIEPAFDISFGSGKYDTMQYLTKAEIMMTESMIKRIVTDFDEFQSHKLYLTPEIPLKQLKDIFVSQYFASNDEQLNFLKQKAMPPPTPAKININVESKYVFNLIQLNQNVPINLKRVSVGGFSQICKSEAEFWYMMTVSDKKMQKIQEIKKDQVVMKQVEKNNKIKKHVRKTLVFKTNNYKGVQAGRNRIVHQQKIVSKFKGVSCIFLPQYYKMINQKSPFSQYLLMEYLPYPNLAQYTEYNKLTMSFLTKIHFASLIIQGLRFLKNYEIVHMDLKPSNIIVAKRQIVKLIDFGESFNKEICDKFFKPAFSMPYGSPQVFDGVGINDFGEKNDVYSWAVIFFELLFKKVPFFFDKSNANKIFKNRSYMKYMHFVPEEQSKYGLWLIIPLMRNVIFKSLDKEYKNRPCTLWLTVLLKQCLSYIINLQITALT